MKIKKLKNNKTIEIGVLLEDFNSKFDLVAEQTAQIPDIKNRIEDLAEDMKTVKEDVIIVKTDLEFIKGALKKKVDVDEFSALERRVIVLESRLR